MTKPVKRILVADDDPMYREIASSELVVASYQVTVASDGGEAEAALDREQFDAAVIDLNMPVRDGLSVIRSMRAKTLNRNTPVVVITGHDDTTAVEAAFKAGATSFLTKPLNWVLFKPHMEFVLRSGQQESELREAYAAAAFLSDLKSQMMTALAGEFQAPIKSILGFSELISKEAYGRLEPHPYREMVQDISKSAKGLNAALLKLMDAGRTLVEQLHVDAEPLKAADAIRDAIAACEEKAARRDIKLSLKLDLDADLVISADRALLNQAFRGIIDNAIRMSPRGTEVFVIASRNSEGDLAVSASDQGPAPSLDTLSEINGVVKTAFAFARFPEPRDVSIKIAKILTEAHQGSMKMKSGREGDNNTVSIVFPAARLMRAGEQAAAAAAVKPAPKPAALKPNGLQPPAISRERLAQISDAIGADPVFQQQRALHQRSNPRGDAQ
jgi:CheY-like chemotaxis protein